MTLDDLLRSLRAFDRPRLPPFFSQRLRGRASFTPQHTPLVMKIYWLFVAFAAAPLAGTWLGLTSIVAVGGLIALTRD
jgi:hypothetical protein